MKTYLARIAHVIAFIGMLAGLTAPVHAVVILDQSNFGTQTLIQGIGGSPGTPGDPMAAQSFTVGIAGTLDSVDVFAARNIPDRVLGIDLVAEVFAASGGLPVGTALASVLVPELSLPAGESGFNIDFSAFDLIVEVGDELAIVLHDSNADDQNTVFIWFGTATDSYAGGHRSLDLGGGFVTDGSDFDVFFNTYVSTGVPEPSSLGLIAIAMLGLGCGRRYLSGDRCQRRPG